MAAGIMVTDDGVMGSRTIGGLIRRYDRPETLFYLDPPYHGSEGDYGAELFSRDDFARLESLLGGLSGALVRMVIDKDDALAENESAVDVMGNDSLKIIAHELLTGLKSNVTVDWSHRESARARMRVLVKRILRRHGYPPDLQDTAVQTVLQQAEALSNSWSGEGVEDERALDLLAEALSNSWSGEGQ